MARIVNELSYSMNDAVSSVFETFAINLEVCGLQTALLVAEGSVRALYLSLPEIDDNNEAARYLDKLRKAIESGYWYC